MGNSAECCGAPGGYALVYHLTSDVEGSSVVVFSTINSAGSVVQVSSTSYFPISLGSVVTYTSTASDGSVIVGSTTTYTAAATSVDSIINSANSVNVRTTGSYAQSSPSTYPYSTAESAGAAIFPMPSAPSPTGSDSGPSSNSAGGSNSGSGSTGSSLSSAGSVGSGTTSSTSSSSSVSSYFVYTSPNTIVTSNTMILGASDTGTTDSASPTISANGVKSDATGAVAGGSSIGATGTGGGTATTNGGATGPEPTSSSAPSCVSAAGYAGNNTKYQDIFGYTYDIRCNLNLDSMPTDNNAHAETFNDCLNYCDLLTGCVAVNYQDAPSKPNNLSNCYPKWSFGGYSPSDPPTDGVYSGVNVNGASPGFSPQDLCTTNNNQGSSYDGQEWYDDYGTPWNIGCDTLIPISSTAALATTVTDTLAACVDYCSTYDSCVMVNWLGPHTNGTASDANCFPASSIGAPGAAGSSPGLGYATLASDSS